MRGYEACPRSSRRGPRVRRHHHRSRLARSWLRLVFGGATTIVCQSPSWHDLAVRVLGRLPSRAPVIANWTASSDLLAIGHARQPREGLVRLLFLGWVDREKGIEDLLGACHDLPAVLPFTLDVAGEGTWSAQARAHTERLGLRDIVRFRGWLRGPDLEAALAAADVLVLPSWAEGLPNAMIEAMAARLAVVVTSVGGVLDVVTDQQTALVVPPRDPAALRRALVRVIDDAPLRQRIADAGFALAAERFAVEPAVDKIIAALRDAMPGASIHASHPV